MAQVHGYAERRRRAGQDLAYAAYGEAYLIALRFAPGKRHPPDLWEVFPFWTAEEVKAERLEKYRKIMEKHAAAGGVKRGG